MLVRRRNGREMSFCHERRAAAMLGNTTKSIANPVEVTITDCAGNGL